MSSASTEHLTDETATEVDMVGAAIEPPGARLPFVSYADVEKSAIALLQRGERPTIEKIRAHLGRGSPNSITKLLDQFYESLGKRLAHGETPDAVVALANEFWGKALALANADVDQRIAQVRASAASLISDAQSAAKAKESEAHDAKVALEHLGIELAEAKATNKRLVDQVAAAHGAQAAQAERISALEQRLSEATNAYATLKSELEAVISNLKEESAAQRRHHLVELDSHRQPRKEAEAKAATLQAKLEEATKAHSQSSADWELKFARATAQIDALFQENARLAKEAQAQATKAEQLAAQLVDAQKRASQAEDRGDEIASAMQGISARLNTLLDTVSGKLG